jgi:hypothetical protein
MRFEVNPRLEPIEVSVVYKSDEYSFSVETNFALPPAFTSVQVNEVQLELDREGRVLYADGYCPHTGWSEMQSNPPGARRGGLFVRDILFAAGVSIRISKERWPVGMNQQTGWVCIGEQLQLGASCAVEFAADSIAVLEGGSLKALWLKPCKLPV